MNYCFAHIPTALREQGFVYLHEVDPSIKVAVRYATHENFVGRPIKGYQAHTIILTKAAAQALKEAQAKFKQDGYCIVVYDAYRPQKAVDDFMAWSSVIEDQQQKKYYYPRVNKADAFRLGYIHYRSGHSRGSTVDISIMREDAQLHEPQLYERTLLDGFIITILDDGTIDMGSSFDLFDEVSHTNTHLISNEHQRMRTYLNAVMTSCGFSNYPQEWWHFTLDDEPFAREDAASYFDFDIS